MVRRACLITTVPAPHDTAAPSTSSGPTADPVRATASTENSRTMPNSPMARPTIARLPSRSFSTMVPINVAHSGMV